MDEEIAPLRNARREDALKSATEAVLVAMDDSKRQLEEKKGELADVEAQVCACRVIGEVLFACASREVEATRGT